jgi:creatinine amidohydrolase/Fe(II)-dependent formamide hydrolase-like protein
VCILPCGAIEQHGPHLPLDVDVVCPVEVARGAGRQAPELLLVLPPVCYGYTGHVLGFPGTISINDEESPFNWMDLFAAGPATLVSWTSSYSPTGTLGSPELASAEKGRLAYDEAVKQLLRFIHSFKSRPVDVRRDHHRQPPTMPMPWGQQSITPARTRRGKSAG